MLHRLLIEKTRKMSVLLDMLPNNIALVLKIFKYNYYPVIYDYNRVKFLC